MKCWTRRVAKRKRSFDKGHSLNSASLAPTPKLASGAENGAQQAEKQVIRSSHMQERDDEREQCVSGQRSNDRKKLKGSWCMDGWMDGAALHLNSASLMCSAPHTNRRGHVATHDDHCSAYCLLVWRLLTVSREHGLSAGRLVPCLVVTDVRL